MAKQPTEWFDEHGNILREIPAECVNDCTTPGQPADESVEYWRKRLGFTVPRERAIRYLSEYGAWEDLETDDDDTLARRVLWLACGDLKEHGEYFGLMH